MNKRKDFSPGFERKAVRLLDAGQKPATDLARELGIRRNQLYKWKEELVKHGAEAFPGMGRRSAGKDEVSRLRKELERVIWRSSLRRQEAMDSHQYSKPCLIVTSRRMKLSLSRSLLLWRHPRYRLWVI
jgi:transposase